MRYLYLGLDLSLVATGWCIIKVKNKIPFVLRYGVISTGKLRGMERLLFIENRIRRIFLTWEILGVGLEGHAIFSRMGKAMDRAELAGIVKRYLMIMGYSIHIIEPKRLKKIITGNGNADKDLMKRVAKKLSGINFRKIIESKKDNVADAFGLAYVALAMDKKIKIAQWRREIMEG